MAENNKNIDDLCEKFTPLTLEKKLTTVKKERNEVQKHGFTWQDQLLTNVYKATTEELDSIKYTAAIDLPAKFNHINPNVNLSIKTSNTLNTVCMGYPINIYNHVNNKEIRYHMTVVFYEQIDETKKKIIKIIEVDLSDSKDILFKDITIEEIEELSNYVKSIPEKRSPTKEEHKKMYEMKDKLDLKMDVFQINIKCNRQQSRIQCSINKFKKFIEEHPERIIAQSINGEFRGGKISNEINSGPRVFNNSEDELLEEFLNLTGISDSDEE